MSAGPLIKHRVAYLHDPEVGQFYYGPSHPMKPHRMQLAHQLIIGYELHNKMMMYSRSWTKKNRNYLGTARRRRERKNILSSRGSGWI